MSWNFPDGMNVALAALALSGPIACRHKPRADAGVPVVRASVRDAGPMFHFDRQLDPHNVFSEVVPPPGSDVHPTLTLLRNQFRKRLLPSDAPALDALDLSGTNHGDPRAMLRRLADQCVRALVPFVFSHAAGDVRTVRPFAARLTHARPVTDAVTAESVLVVLRAAKTELETTRARLSAQSGRDGGIAPDESLVDEFQRVESEAEDLLAVIAREDAGAATAGVCSAGDAGMATDAGDEDGGDNVAGEGEGAGEGEAPRPFKPEGESAGDSLADLACSTPEDAAIVLSAALASDVEELSDARASEPVLRALRAVIDVARHPAGSDAGAPGAVSP